MKLRCCAHVASSGQKLPCRTLIRSSLGPWLRSKHCRARARRCCAAARLCSSLSWKKHLYACSARQAFTSWQQQCLKSMY